MPTMTDCDAATTHDGKTEMAERIETALAKVKRISFWLCCVFVFGNGTI